MKNNSPQHGDLSLRSITYGGISLVRIPLYG
jgi:hypothetical protein